MAGDIPESDSRDSDIRAAVADYSGWLFADRKNPRRVHVRESRNDAACGSGNSEDARFPLVALNEGYVWCGHCVEEVVE